MNRLSSPHVIESAIPLSRCSCHGAFARGASSPIRPHLEAGVGEITEARRRGIPAFRIFTDQALRAMVSKRPETDRELLAIPGIGMTTVKQYGPQIYRVIHGSSV